VLHHLETDHTFQRAASRGLRTLAVDGRERLSSPSQIEGQTDSRTVRSSSDISASLIGRQKPLIEKPTQTQTKMNITQKHHSQTSQSLFRLSLKNTRIAIKVNGNINQILTGPCNKKIAFLQDATALDTAASNSVFAPQCGKAPKHQNRKAAK
jgi:hypothetical protein